MNSLASVMSSLMLLGVAGVLEDDAAGITAGAGAGLRTAVANVPRARGRVLRGTGGGADPGVGRPNGRWGAGVAAGLAGAAPELFCAPSAGVLVGAEGVLAGAPVGAELPDDPDGTFRVFLNQRLWGCVASLLPLLLLEAVGAVNGAAAAAVAGAGAGAGGVGTGSCDGNA